MLSHASGSAAEIQLKTEYVCRRPLVKVGDLVELRNIRRDEADEIAAIELFAAPTGGEIRNVKIAELRELLTLHGVDLASVQFRGPDQIRIHGARGNDVPGARALDRTESVKLAFHARRSIARGETIRASDVESRPLAGTATKQEYVTRAEDIVGHTAVRVIDAGQPVVPNSLQRPLIVMRNETISLVARSAGVQVRTSAKALEDGALGDLITIETIEKSKNKLAARVVGPKTVEIYAGVPVVSSNQ